MEYRLSVWQKECWVVTFKGLEKKVLNVLPLKRLTLHDTKKGEKNE
jgi:hypothetical protein